MPTPTRATTKDTLADELEAIANAAARRLHAQTHGGVDVDRNPHQAVANAASAAIAAGLPLAAIADAERVGEARARAELRPDVLRQITRAARRKRDSEAEYEQTVILAVRLGLAQREIAAAAEVTHGTVRAIIDRAEKSSHEEAPTTEHAQPNETHAEQPRADQQQPTTPGPATREAA